MAQVFVGLAMGSTMFRGECLISRSELTVDTVRELLGSEVVSCCNPSHQATITALREKFGIEIPIPESPPQIVVGAGDTLLVLSARFTRRLAEGERYSPEEVEAAKFEFVAYRVFGPDFHPVQITEDGFVRNQWGSGLGYIH